MSEALADFIVAVISFIVGFILGYAAVHNPAQAHEPITTQVVEYKLRCTKLHINMCEEYTLFKVIKE